MNKGFTFVEILVVITIIAVLTAVGAVSYGALTKNSRDARRKADVEQIRAAVELYRSKNNSYPTTISTGNTLCDPGPDCTSGKYMEDVPDDPTTKYSYYYSGSASDYTVGAYIEGSTSTCGVTIACTGTVTVNCNYCMGPYGQK